MEDRSQIIARLIVKALSHSITDTEKKILEDWLAESPEHQDVYEQFRNEDELLKNMIYYNGLNQKYMQAGLNQPLYRPEGLIVRRLGQFFNSNKYWLSAAAAVLLAAVIILWNWDKPTVPGLAKREAVVSTAGDNPAQKNSNPSKPVKPGTAKKPKAVAVADLEMKTNKGVYDSITLSDGTRIWLNEASVLYYPQEFTGNERHVRITGEAYFEIAKVPGQPFIVTMPVSASTGETASIEALGTAFNVNTYSESKKVTVIEGHVKVSVNTAAPGLNPGNLIKTLAPGEQAQLTGDGKITIQNITAGRAPDWRTTLRFENTITKEAVRQIASFFGITVSGSEYLDKLPDCTHNNIEIQRHNNIVGLLKMMKKECPQFKYTYDAVNKRLTISPTP